MSIRELWNDPVWSKVIAGGIAAAFSAATAAAARAYHRAPQATLVDPSGKRLRSWALFRTARPGMLITFAAIAFLLFVLILTLQTLTKDDSGRELVVVADFDGPDPSAFRVTEAIFEQVHTALREYPNIEVRRLNATIPIGADQLAYARARETRASLILWGVYSRTHVKVHFHLSSQRIQNLLLPSTDSVVMSLDSLERFEVDTPLPPPNDLSRPHHHRLGKDGNERHKWSTLLLYACLTESNDVGRQYGPFDGSVGASTGITQSEGIRSYNRGLHSCGGAQSRS
jgi:hypothetical protein